MPLDPVLFVILALALGFKHSYDADHLVAVSNLLTRSKSLRKTAWMSASWAAGHMVTATVITVLLYEFRQSVLKDVLGNLELAVAVMLVVIGVFGLLVEFGFIHRHPHRHETEEHEHIHVDPHGERDPGTDAPRPSGIATEHRAMFGIGIVHGLASNDELLILFVASLSVTSLPGLLGGVAVFSLGVVIGMVVFGLGISYPVSRWGSARVRRVVNIGAAVLSISYAAYLFLGFEGINLLPFARL
ncbi:MAG TPA: hypothetical protein VJP06_06520 [Thermoplasmata archaeon]|nr:hypothetical protein [Thermoplasmata archaeon]